MELSPDEVRIISLSAPMLLKMLKAREERTILRIYGEFRSGKENQLSSIAELACVRDQINEIQSIMRLNEASKE